MPIILELDLDDVIEGLEQLPAELDAQTRRWMRASLELVAATARELAPKGATSLLSESIQALPVSGSFSEGTLEGTVEAGAPYALAVELGTRPHEIKPRFRRALRWPVAGGFAFAKRVRHPGTAPQPFLEPAIEQNADSIADELEAAIELAFHRAGF